MNRLRALMVATCVIAPALSVPAATAATVQPAPAVVAATKAAVKSPIGPIGAAKVPAPITESSESSDGNGVSATATEAQPSDQAAAVVAAPLALAEEPNRTWLRRSAKSEPEAPIKDDGGFPFTAVAFVIVAGLVGGAVFLRKRRGRAVPWLATSPVRVLSTTRIGPKANLVTVDVHGRVLLLGVTEETVSELGWVEGALEANANDDTETSGLEHSAQLPGERVHEGQSGFNHVFSSMFGGSERGPKERTFRGNPEVAALIAARETRDVVSTGAFRSGHAAQRRVAGGSGVSGPAPRVETQVAGLMKRRR